MLSYSKTLRNGESDWVVSEEAFSDLALAKCETVMALGNGYMGLRSATEEAYVGEKRNWFVNGTFNRFDEHEVTELPNAADVTHLDIRVDGERFSLKTGKIVSYERRLNLREAELVRTVVWISPAGSELEFCFRRFVSLDALHLVGMKVEVRVRKGKVVLAVSSGIDAQVTNSGSQHFHEGEKRIYDKRYLELIQTTTESKIDFVLGAAHRLMVNGTELTVEPAMEIDRRRVAVKYRVELQEGETLSLEKLATLHTSRDREWIDRYALAELREACLLELKAFRSSGYEALFIRHAAKWAEVWRQYGIAISSTDGFDPLAIRFAQYHLVAMTPAHDSRMGIAAKGLTGEGYKGHSFWDTEIFILPFYLFSNPPVARSLLEYRFHGLEGARRKAKENGYAGAMYPWEAAWPSDGEVTPVWGAVDIVTGKQTKIWSGFIEQHITADIAYAVWKYEQVTGDREFMERCGYEMIFDTAIFWASRLEWNEALGRYEIRGVVGPDEYKEHVNNNAFTNYMAHFNMELALRYCVWLEQENPMLYASLDQRLGLAAAREDWPGKLANLYLPQPNEAGIIPQDDTYLTKPSIDLSPYKGKGKVGSLFDRYNLEQVIGLQISKQADVLMLFFLLEDRFPESIKNANYAYYEEKTLHDSSLSLSTHSILAGDFGDHELAYRLFRRAAEIDLGPFPHSSDTGIHAASLGGIWECVVLGFAGARMLDGELHLNPRLPEHWTELSFPLYLQDQRLNICLTPQETLIDKAGEKPVRLYVNGQLREI
jgi:hypothetical glycosyl hydrolase